MILFPLLLFLDGWIYEEDNSLALATLDNKNFRDFSQAEVLV